MSFNFNNLCIRQPPVGFFPNPPFDGSERPWTRAAGQLCLNIPSNQLDMRRKAEILKYKNNNSNLSSKRILARKLSSIGVEQKAWATQPFISNSNKITPQNKAINTLTNFNIRNLPQNGFTLLCNDNQGIICKPTYFSNVPGNSILCYDKNIPLVNFKENFTYSNIGTTWPQRSWQPGDNGFPVGKIGNLQNILNLENILQGDCNYILEKLNNPNLENYDNNYYQYLIEYLNCILNQ